ncbi:hypothetical protein JCM5350_005959 [Sporobolomyces pararoseus]
MTDSNQSLDIENASSIDPTTLVDQPPSRRLSFTTPFPPPSTTTPTTLDQPTTDEQAIENTKSDQDSGWKEPELGFENIQLNDHHQPLPSHPSNDTRRDSNTSSTTTTSTPSSVNGEERVGSNETVPTSTELEPSKDPLATSTSSSTSASASASVKEQQQSLPRPPPTSPPPNSTMSLPPDPSKIEQPSPSKQLQQKTSKSPSVMQKIVSMTRQRDLPPKNKEEEEKHLKELEQMLAASKEIEKRRKIEREEKLKLKNQALNSAFPTWETQILPNWRSVLHDTSQGKQLRKLWWQGTMPIRYRGRLWSLCIGNSLAISKNSFNLSLERARKYLELGREGIVKFKREAEGEMEGVLKGLKLFQKEGGVMHQDLLDLLLAWSVHDTDRGILEYPKGLAYSASLLLVNQPTPEAYISLLNLISKSFLSSFYSPPRNRESLNSYERVFDTLLADSMPKIYSNFSSSIVRPSLYLVPWLTTLFLKFLPLELVTRLFDVFLLEGDSFMFRVSLVLLKVLEPRLFNPDLEELEKVFKGKDQGAVAIVKREKGLLVTPGTTTTTSSSSGEEEGEEEEEEGGGVEIEEVYTEMGCTEERIFRELEELDWKEETWERLVERELPDA